ncbi:MAG: hypothetical protein GYA33_14620 [Thermogutta sp.]|nr:hypothetical protein [Thermogutta sp.]
MANDQPRPDRWQELASLLGITPPAEEPNSSTSSAPSAEDAPGASPRPEPSAEPALGDKAVSEPITMPSPAATTGDPARSIGIPLRVDWKRERKTGGWEAVTAELGLAPPQPATPPAAHDAGPPRKDAPVTVETKPRRSPAGPPARRPNVDTAVLDPVYRTVEPPVLPEAEMVAITLPDADVSAVDEKVITAEPIPAEGLELEGTVVAPSVIPQDMESQLAPLEAAVGEFVDESSAVAADTITTESVSQEDRAKRKRRRRRRKTPITIAAEPFEAELPSIVAEAAAESDDDEDVEPIAAAGEADTIPADEPSESGERTRDRGRRRPRETSAPSASDDDELSEDRDAASEGEGKAVHKAVPTWAETVAHVIQKNMENHRRRGGSGRGRNRS